MFFLISDHSCLFSLQVVMTIIVAFILDAFVFRMNYSRKNREALENSGGGTLGLRNHLLKVARICVKHDLFVNEQIVFDPNPIISDVFESFRPFKIRFESWFVEKFLYFFSCTFSRWERHCVWSGSNSWWSCGHSGPLQTDVPRTLLFKLSTRCLTSDGQEWGKKSRLQLSNDFHLIVFLFLGIQHTSLVYIGRRSRTKSDLSMKMYEEEIQVRHQIRLTYVLFWVVITFSYFVSRNGTQSILGKACLNRTKVWSRNWIVLSQICLLLQNLASTLRLDRIASTNAKYASGTYLSNFIYVMWRFYHSRRSTVCLTGNMIWTDVTDKRWFQDFVWLLDTVQICCGASEIWFSFGRCVLRDCTTVVCIYCTVFILCKPREMYTQSLSLATYWWVLTDWVDLSSCQDQV